MSDRNVIRRSECSACGTEVKRRRVPKSGHTVEAIGCDHGCCWVQDRDGLRPGVPAITRMYVAADALMVASWTVGTHGCSVEGVQKLIAQATEPAKSRNEVST